MSAPFARLRSLGVRYGAGARAVQGLAPLDLDILPGEKLGVIGESGSGKTTLARALAGLLPADAATEGTLEWPGLKHGRPIPGRDVGFVFQDPGASLNPVLTVGEQVAEVARRHLGLSRLQARERAAGLFGRVRLPEGRALLSAYPHQLSGGQRQRVGIAAAIAAGPKLLIADEPTSALDLIVQAEIVALIGQLVEEDGMTLVFVTHDLALASGFADRIAVFQAAHLVEVGPTAEVIGRPQSPHTRALLASHLDLASEPLVARSPR